MRFETFLERLRKKAEGYASSSEISDENLYRLRCGICRGCNRIDICKRLERIPYEKTIINPICLYSMIKNGTCPDSNYESYKWDEGQVS